MNDIEHVVIVNYHYITTALREEDNSDGADSYIEQCMGKQEPIEKVMAVVMAVVMIFFKVLRLICLQSLANSGLKPKLLERYKMGIIQVCLNMLWCIISLHFLVLWDATFNFTSQP